MIVKRQTELFCDWLENYLNYERISNREGFSLETMQFLVNRFKNPEQNVKMIHVAGSKGKGSISTMISRILTEYGFETGLYLSPHLLDFTERITLAGKPFSDLLYGIAADKVVPLVESIIPQEIPGNREPTWFELVTLFAFVVFNTARMKWAVIETGLGGRLDATNVITPLACVFTPIELEHTEYLGKSIEMIAKEKAGIIKAGVPVFTSFQHPTVRAILEKKAKELSCPFFSMDDSLESVKTTLSLTGLDTEITYSSQKDKPVFEGPICTRLSLLNEIQANNAALAAFVVKYLLPDISNTVISKGLSSAWLPGRFELISADPLIILDGAHTVDSIALTLNTFDSLTQMLGELVFACAADKNVDVIATEFGKRFSQITLTRPGDVKKSDINHTVLAFKEALKTEKDVNIEVNADYVSVLKNAFKRSRAEKKPLLITGSFYLVAEAKKILAKENLDL
ncbi:MAG TPA: bifunctional folylpolyglutamate synthase/dihydrofolate synthase [Treponema sp.]|nr:bifunctional folylpolyglutamate synthase/dihydrofolate synthase [Treponema sp.]